MPTYTSTQLTAPVAPVSGPGIGGRNVRVFQGDVTVTAALTTADTLPLFDLPKGVRIIGGYIKASDMDTNGTPTLALNVGVPGTATQFWAASTVGQAGTVAEALAVTGYGYTTTGKTRVTCVPSANAATGVAGTLQVVLFGTVEEPA